MFWLGKQFNNPSYADKERLRLMARPWTANIFHLIWDPGVLPSPSMKSLPLNHFFKGINVATFRSAWEDPKALFVGFKGGVGGIAHGHLDHGSFVLDAFGQRWALDLGRDLYSLPGYFKPKSGERWKYYRLATEGHNTLTVGGGEQDFKADSPIIAFSSSPNNSFAIADLKKAYSGKFVSALRGIKLLNKNQVIIQDELTPIEGKVSNVVWHFHTPASIQIQDSTATLTQNGQKIILSILSPPNLKFSMVSAKPTSPPGQNQNVGVTDLTISIPIEKNSVKVVVVIGSEGQTSSAILPLDQWK